MNWEQMLVVDEKFDDRERAGLVEKVRLKGLHVQLPIRMGYRSKESGVPS